MRAPECPEGARGRNKNAIGRPSGVPGGRRTIGSGDGGMFGLVVNGRVELVLGVGSSVLASFN